MTSSAQPVLRLMRQFGLTTDQLSVSQHASADAVICRWRSTIVEMPDLEVPCDLLVRLRSPTRSHRSRGGRTEDASGLPGHLGLLPSGSHGSWRYDNAHPLEVTHVYFPRGFWAASTDLLPSSGAPRLDEHLRLDDPVLASLLAELDRGLDRNAAPRLFFDGLTNAIAARLAEAHSATALNPAKHFRGSQQDWRLRRAVEFLEAHLSEDVGISDLATSVHLSPSHLASLFRAGLGEAPHRWLMRRRIQRACELLTGTQDSVTHIAHALGFASSQHLATVFSKHMGTTPTAYRRERQR